MTITEFAILPFKSTPDLSDPILHALFRQLSAWQSECSGFSLRFYMNAEDEEPLEVYLVTGWVSVEAHEEWIRGERNQELLRVFAPHVDIARVRMVHVDVDFEAMRDDAGATGDRMVIERYDGAQWGKGPLEEKEGSGRRAWLLVGRDLALDGGDVFHFVGVAGDEDGQVARAAKERWVLKRVEL